MSNLYKPIGEDTLSKKDLAIHNSVVEEQGRLRPDKYYIKNLEKMWFKKRIEIHDFISTMREVPRQEFEKRYPKTHVQKECSSMLTFAFGINIQVLGERPGVAYHFEGFFDGVWITMTNRDFDTVVSQVYNLFIEEMLNLWKKDY